MSINRQDYFLPGIQNKKPSPVHRLWILAIILVVALTLIGIFTWRYLGRSKQNPDTQTKVISDTENKGNSDTAVGNNLKGKYCYAGEPRTTPSFKYQITVLTNDCYLVGYCEQLGDPIWVAFKLHKINSFIAPKRKDNFRTDTRTKTLVSPADYKNSGYDKGHMMASYIAGIMYDEEAQDSTFLMSNMTPQKPRLNQSILRGLEEKEAKTLANKYGDVWVIRGAIFKEPIMRLKGKVAVPSAIFEIWAREETGQPKVLALKIGQDVNGKEQQSSFICRIRDLEDETGLDFMSELPKLIQDDIEVKKGRIW